MGGNPEGNIHKFNTVQQLQTLLTSLTQGMNPCDVLITGEANELDLYITLREGAVKIGTHSDLGDDTSA